MIESIFDGSFARTCLVGLLVGMVVYWLIKRRRYNYPPGPWAIPLVGNAFQIDRARLHEQAFEWSKTYGPVITIRIGPTPMVIVNSIDAAHEVLLKKSTDFAGRLRTASVDLLTDGGKDIAFASYGPLWKVQRKVASKALRHYMLGNALEVRIHDAVRTVFDEIDKTTGEFDPLQYVGFITGNILIGLCFGGKYDYNDVELTSVLKIRDDMIERFGIGPWEDYIPGLKHVYKTDVFKQFEKFTAAMIDDFIKVKFKLAKASYTKDKIRHLADTLLLAQEESMHEEDGAIVSQLEEDHLVHTLADIFFAGSDTSRISITSAILHMIAYPDIQEKVQQEIDRVVGPNRLPSVKDRPNLAYTEAVLHESMRLGSVLPLGLAHLTLCDTDICGYKIPKGTLVSINHWALHNDPKAWEDVTRFIPERFLDADGKLGPKPISWLPFGAGTRVCLGEFVAKPNLHLIFASLMQRYRWKMDTDKCPDLTRTGAAFGLSYKPYKVIVERRH